jgi:hypothetical protein
LTFVFRIQNPNINPNNNQGKSKRKSSFFILWISPILFLSSPNFYLDLTFVLFLYFDQYTKCWKIFFDLFETGLFDKNPWCFTGFFIICFNSLIQYSKSTFEVNFFEVNFFWILDWMDDWTSNQIQLQKS